MIAGIALVAVIAASACSSDEAKDAETFGYPVARLREIALNAARGNGDRPPSSIEVVRTNFDRANAAVSGDQVFGEPDTPVYVVQLRGDFICSRCTAPGSPEPPAISVITLVVDAQTFRGREGAFGDRVVNLETLGDVLTIAP